MAVIPTGAIYKALFFDGESSRNYGVYITGEAVYNSPERDVEMIKIPGRNGEFALDNGRFENIEVTYPAGIFANNETDFAAAISDFRNFLASRVGYCRLEDEYNPNEYRMAVYKSGLNVDPAKLEAGEFSITFDCKPQRWLKDGETAVAIGEWGETETASGDIVTVENPNGILAVKSLEVDLEPIQDLNGYDKPWVGGAGKNKLVLLADEIKAVNTAGTWSGNTYTVSGMTYTLNTDSYGHIVSVTINGTTTTYPTFRIPINGLTVGQSYKLYRGNFRSRLIKDNATVNDASSAYTFTAESGDYWVVLFTGASTISNVTVQPMVCLDSETSTFEPYENICPISGHDSVDTYRTGINVWDEEWEVGGISATDGSNADNFTQRIRSKGYISVVPETQYRFIIGSNSSTPSRTVFWYDVNKTYISGGWTTPTNNIISVPSNARYMRFTTNDNYGGTYNNDISINYPSTDTEYHAYQGTTYTTELGRAVYGGNLEQISGVLTDNMAIYQIAANTNFSAVQTSQAAGNWVEVLSVTNARTADTEVLTVSECCKSVSNNNRAVDVNDYRCYAANGHLYLSAPAGANVTTKEDFHSIFDGYNIVYELATPQTYQLTAQQIDLLTGDNNIWSSGGNVTLEYGQNPSVLFNPTLFESSPLLETAGNGTIGFNGYEIEFEGVPYGEVVIGEKDSYSLSNTVTVTLDTSLLNTNDPIYPEAKECEIRLGLQYIGSKKFGNDSVVSSTNALDAYTSKTNPLLTKKHLIMHLFPDLGDGFVYGTAKTITSSAVYTYKMTGDSTVYTETVSVTIAYGGADTYTVSGTFTGTLPPDVSMFLKELHSPTMYGDSSKPNTDPIFIDCDLGEAYTNEDGVYRSLNQYIDLGSELPKLGVGENEVTFDSTITELKITPRWWKV